MIYKNVGAGLVGFQYPDTDKLFKEASDLKAATWGLPELDDIAPPKLDYEKDLDTTWTEGINKYYALGESLAKNAMNLRQVGIDVTKPSPFVKNSVEAAGVWNQQYNDWLELGKRLKNSLVQKKYHDTKSLQTNVLSVPYERNQELTDASTLMTDLDDTNAKKAAQAWTNSWKSPVYGNQSLQKLSEDYDKAVKVVSDAYEVKKRTVSDPELVEQLDQNRDELLAQMTPPIGDEKFDQLMNFKKAKLQFEKQKEANRQYWKNWESTSIETGVADTFDKLYKGEVSDKIFSSVPTGQWATNYRQNDDGTKTAFSEKTFIHTYKGTYKKPDGSIVMQFSTYPLSGQNQEGSFEVQYKKPNGEVNIQNMRLFKEAVEESISSKASYNYGNQQELPVGHKTTKGTTNVNVESSKVKINW